MTLPKAMAFSEASGRPRGRNAFTKDAHIEQGVTMRGVFVSLLAASSLCGCSTIFEGTSQEIAINTNPSAADCTVMREGIPVGRVNPTPGIVLVKKTKHNLAIVCTKEGFQQASAGNHSDAAGATAANVLGIWLAPIFWGIDSATGADNKYDAVVNITLLPVMVGGAEPPSAPSAAIAPENAMSANPATATKPDTPTP